MFFFIIFPYKNIFLKVFNSKKTFTREKSHAPKPTAKAKRRRKKKMMEKDIQMDVNILRTRRTKIELWREEFAKLIGCHPIKQY